MMSSSIRVAATIVALVALAMIGACSLTRPAPVKASYLLEPAWPSPAAKAQSGSVRVGAMTVAAPFRGRSFVVRDTDLRFDADFYHEFFVPPAVILADATTQALVRARLFADVTRPGVVADANWVLDGFVGALYGDARDPARPAAVLEITYFLSRDDSGASVPVWTRSYQRRIAFAAGETSAYVAALNTALSEILAELAGDLAAAQLPAK